MYAVCPHKQKHVPMPVLFYSASVCHVFVSGCVHCSCICSVSSLCSHKLLLQKWGTRSQLLVFTMYSTVVNCVHPVNYCGFLRVALVMFYVKSLSLWSSSTVETKLFLDSLHDLFTCRAVCGQRDAPKSR